jgi:hypothetical protein
VLNTTIDPDINGLSLQQQQGSRGLQATSRRCKKTNLKKASGVEADRGCPQELLQCGEALLRDGDSKQIRQKLERVEVKMPAV